MADTKICSMYSYKGGTGRTVATANIACILALPPFSKKVVCIDMDLDGGGLAVVFKVHKEVNNDTLRIEDKRRCMQDVFRKEINLNMGSSDENANIITLNYDEISSDKDFMENWWGKMNYDIGNKLDKKEIKGKLFFIPARFGTDSIDTGEDEFKSSFSKFMNSLVDNIEPDIILMDSSSGFQDYTVLMIEWAHVFVMFFRWNSQAIEGTIEAAKHILTKYDPSTTAKMLLVPSAVPKASLENYKGILNASERRIDNEIVVELKDKEIVFFKEGIGESTLLKWKEEILVFSDKLAEEEKKILEDYVKVAKLINEL